MPKVKISIHAQVFLTQEEFEAFTPRNPNEDTPNHLRRIENSLQDHEKMVLMLRRVIQHFSSGTAGSRPEDPNVLTWTITQ